VINRHLFLLRLDRINEKRRDVVAFPIEFDIVGVRKSACASPDVRSLDSLPLE
jgi:hypothetical protein